MYIRRFNENSGDDITDKLLSDDMVQLGVIKEIMEQYFDDVRLQVNFNGSHINGHAVVHVPSVKISIVDMFGIISGGNITHQLKSRTYTAFNDYIQEINSDIDSKLWFDFFISEDVTIGEDLSKEIVDRISTSVGYEFEVFNGTDEDSDGRYSISPNLVDIDDDFTYRVLGIIHDLPPVF